MSDFKVDELIESLVIERVGIREAMLAAYRHGANQPAPATATMRFDAISEHLRLLRDTILSADRSLEKSRGAHALDARATLGRAMARIDNALVGIQLASDRGAI